MTLVAKELSIPTTHTSPSSLLRNDFGAEELLGGLPILARPSKIERILINGLATSVDLWRGACRNSSCIVVRIVLAALRRHIVSRSILNKEQEARVPANSGNSGIYN
jgi:hypothetical protein